MSEDNENLNKQNNETTEASLKLKIQELETTLEQKCKQQEEKYLRIIAEYENRMKRTKQDATHSLNIAIENIASDFTPIIYDLKKAQIEMKENKGIELIINKMNNTFSKYGITQITPKTGDEFDPNFHQAISSEKKEGFEPGTIIEVMEVGYKNTKS